MSYKQGETTWYDKFTDKQKEEEHRKPWVAGGGALLAEAGAIPSVGSKGDSYDNAMAESINGLYKSELIHNETMGPWRTVDDVELATLGWVHWWNHERILEPIGNVPPAEFEATWKESQKNQPLQSPESGDLVDGGMKTSERQRSVEALVGLSP